MANIYMTSGMKLKPDATTPVNIHAWRMPAGSVREFGRDGFKIVAVNFTPYMVNLVSGVSGLLGQQIEAKSQDILEVSDDDIIIVAHFIQIPGSTDEYTVEFTGHQLKHLP